MGTHFCADRLGLPGHQPLCGMVRVPPVSGLQHALRSQGDHGVRTSFTDFLQGKGKRCGKSSQRDFAGPKGAVSNECNNSGEMQGPYKGQAMRLFFPSKTIGKPGVGKGNGVQGKTNIERLGKGSNDSVLGRIKLSPWGPGHGGIAATTAIPMNKGYWAKSTLAVKMSRREEVTTLARMVAGQNQFLPLSKEVVEAVAAALKAAGLASADHYLNELKLLHVEPGFHLEQWLARTFQLCKKSVVRERGPVKRATEFQLEDVVLEAWKMTDEVAVSRATWAYAWGLAWMLREVELSKVCWEHISWNAARKTVRLYIPSSKTDQKGLGVARTLQCCGLKPCWRAAHGS